MHKKLPPLLDYRWLMAQKFPDCFIIITDFYFVYHKTFPAVPD